MKRIFAVALLSLSSMAAFAQTGGVPPTQAPAGEAMKKAAPAPAADGMAPTAKAEKKAARKAKRAAKVGDKPIN